MAPTHSGTPINSRIGERLHTARRQQGVTQQSLAQQAGMSFVVISRLESGLQSVSAERLASLAKVLHLSLDFLCGD
jgi:transcriptional regulator with XRE-family HTH domain